MDYDVTRLSFKDRQGVHWARNMRLSAIIMSILGLFWIIGAEGDMAGVGFFAVCVTMIFTSHWSIRRIFRKYEE